MMAQWTLFSAALLFASNAVADVLVQPGYGQPQAIVQPHSTLHPIVQPPSTLRQASEKEENQQQDSFDPGYHLELHPVYSGVPQVPADQTVSYSLLQPHQLTPYLSKSAQRRLNSGKLGDLGVVGLPLGVPTALSSQYVPLAVHSRHRRSSGDKPSAGLLGEKPDKADVAAKSSLNENVPAVVDLQSLNGESTKNLDEKRVGVRQSEPMNTAGLLLGLNPSNMYPVYQYRAVETNPQNPASNSFQQIISPQAYPQTLPQVSSRASTQEQTSSQHQAATPTQTMTMNPQVNLLKLQHVVPMQQSAPQLPQQSGILQNSVEQEQRNAPDPRSGFAVSQPVTRQAPNVQNEQQSSVDGRQAEIGDDNELVGNRHKIKVHVHRHETLTIPRSASSESYGCTCTNPGYVVYDGSPSNLALAPASSQSTVQVYQLPSVQGTSYSPNANYMVSPTYSNYVTNGLSYLPSASSFNYCPQNLNSAPPLTYRLI